MRLCRDELGRGDAFVEKITGNVDRPLQRIRQFRNRPTPGVVVTVDLLSTGVDIPDLEFIVFLRPVKSRILFEQMLGRGTRKGERFQNKSHFTVFDCFGGTLLAYFKNSTGMTTEPPNRPTRTIPEVIEDIWNNRDREYYTKILVKRLQRIDKEMAGEAREAFSAYVLDGDVAAYARQLPRSLAQDFVGSMKLLRNQSFQDLLVHYLRPPRTFVVALGAQDTVTSEWLPRDAAGNQHRPEDYLEAFVRFIEQHRAEIAAIGILLDRPREWNSDALAELRRSLLASKYQFSVEKLQRVHELKYHRALVDIISMIKHAANEEAPLLTAPERVDRALARLRADRMFTADQETWLARIREHLCENLSLDREDFDVIPIFANAGGWAAARRAFGDELLTLLHGINEAIAA